jgi:hypothetical protein
VYNFREDFMDFFSQRVIKHKKSIMAIFLIVAVVCAVLALLVSVNYDMVQYLPKDAQSTTAIDILSDEFGGKIPNARVMLTDVSIHVALEYKEKLASIDGVTSVDWLDDVTGLDVLKTTPLEFLDASVLENYYKDNNALISLTIDSGKVSSAVDEIRQLIGEHNAVAGEAVNMAQTQSMSVTEVLNAMALLLPIIIIILILSTDSWVEPALFLASIGIAVVINMGTNIIFGEISFITLTVSPVLQLAVSLDYAIFLLHSFNSHRQAHEPAKAMMLAIKEAFPSVAASAATTVIGFAALLLMRFTIGADLGLNLLKGVMLSFISVIVFLPVLTMSLYKLIDKTRHRKLIPSLKKTGGWLMKVRIPFLILALIIAVPCFLAQSKATFSYGTGSIASASRAGKDAALIEENFGSENTLVLLVPRENAGKESELCDELADIPHITNVISYVTAVGAEIPPEFVPAEAAEQFYSEHYARVILYTDTEEEGDAAFDTVRTVMETADKYYDTYYLAGQSATLYDMKQVVAADTQRINLAAIAGIFVVLLITFRSPVLPLFLIFSIENAIWISLSFPYFAEKPLSFIGYLIISTVQLGATVDYAILFTNAYMNNRKTLPKKEAMKAAIGDNLISILTSAVILATAGFALAFTASNPIISDLGTLLGRGALLSLGMVSLVLPAFLVLFDKVIKKTTIKADFID